MRKILALCIALVLLTAGTALAVKPDHPGSGKGDLETETQARIDADADLQNQINDNVLDISDNAADIQANTNAINALKGGIKIYDNSNQYIGILLSADGAGYFSYLYIPSLDANAMFVEISNPSGRSSSADIYTDKQAYYASNDCSGTPYATSGGSSDFFVLS
jgi:hypothetical protein